MLSHSEFANSRSGLLRAPAGFGKTHTIVECLKHTHGKQLILTHTHAGVASIREKLAKANTPPNSYAVETITSFAQRITTSFYRGADIPSQEDKGYHEFVTVKATELVAAATLMDVISLSYTGLFVDEYQDCNIPIHKFIMALCEILPTKILGDHLQGIFGFGGNQLVDMRSPEHMGDFLKDPKMLTEPWRWKNGGNRDLGEALKTIRAGLESTSEANLSLHRACIELHEVPTGDMYEAGKSYNKELWKLINSPEGMLFITPHSENKNKRKEFVTRFANKLTMLESLDSDEFYAAAKAADLVLSKDPHSEVYKLCRMLFSKTAVNEWITDRGIKRKTDKTQLAKSDELRMAIESLHREHSWIKLKQILLLCFHLPGMKCYRREILRSVFRALEIAHSDGCGVYEAMKKERNITRRVGRKIKGKCIGTTLLTKGLEFDVVVVLDANHFENAKHLYVALTRASKRLVVFLEDPVISFDKVAT